MAAHFGSLTDPPASLMLVGVRVIDPAGGTDTVRDLAISEGRLVDPAELDGDVPRIEANGLIATAGFTDLHTHLREPGAEGSEDIKCGTRAAAKGGFTTVCAMPNTDPPADEPARIAWVAARGRDAAARVELIGCVTRGRGGESLTDLADLKAAGAIAVSDDGAAIPSARLARSALQTLAALDMPLIEHAEEPALAGGTLMRSGMTATRLGLAGWPASAELTVVERDIALAEEVGASVHLTHLSTTPAAEAVRRAKGRGVRVTCDVTPHHLAMTDAWVGGDRSFAWEDTEPEEGSPFTTPLDPSRAYDGVCRVNPPLPSREDALALLQALADGTIDAIATDHAPHAAERKAVSFSEAAPGMIGLETALSVGLAAVEAGCLSLARLLEALTTGPATVLGRSAGLRVGDAADLTLFDPARRWRVEPEALASRSANTPLIGMELPGIVRLTIADGRITYNDGLVRLG